MSAQTYPVLQRARVRGESPGVAAPLALAALCAAAMGLVWVLAALVPATHYRDAVILHDFTVLNGPGFLPVAILLFNPLVFVLWGIALVAFAFAQERFREAATLAAVIILAPLSADVLKRLTAHPHASVGGVLPNAASWPSGHSTVVLLLVLSTMLLTPARRKPLVACVGGIYALGVGAALLIFASHMPSDVIGGFLLAIFWMSLAVATLRAVERRWPTRSASGSAHQRDMSTA